MKFIEIVLQKIAELRGIDVGIRDENKFIQIVEGTDLSMVLKTEFAPCASCSGIINTVTSKLDGNSNPYVEISISGGTFYNVPQ